MAHMYTFSIRTLFCAGLAAVLIATGLTGCGGRRSEQLQERGDTYLHIARYSEAVNEYERAIAADPENAAAYLGKGRALAAQGETEDALKAFEEAVELKSDYEEAHTEAVHLLVEEGREEEALEMAHSFATADPLKGGALLAHTQHRVGASADAIETLEQLRDQYPGEEHAHVNLALLYLAQGDYNEAETTFRRVLDTIDETSLPARMGLIDVHRAQGNLEEVIEGLRDLVAEEQQRNPEAADAPQEGQYLTTLKLALARSLLETGEFEEAEEIAQPILEAIPESGWANYIVGACMLQRDEYAEALQYLQIAARALPEQPAVDRRLARAEQRRGEEPDEEEEETLAARQPDEADETWETLWREARLRELLENREAILAEENPQARRSLAVGAMIIRQMNMAEELVAPLPADDPLKRLFEHFREGDHEGIMAVLEEWDPSEGHATRVRNNAEAAVMSAMGMRARAFSTLVETLNAYPEDAVALLNMGLMYQNAGMPEFTASTFQQLVSRYPDVMEHRAALFGALMEADHHEEARYNAESTYSTFPRRVESVLLLAQAYQATGDTALATEALKRGVQNMPEEVRLQLYLSEAQVRVGNTESARELLEEVRRDSAMETSAAWLDAFISAHENDWTNAREQLESIPMNELNLAGRLLLSAARIAAGEEDDALAPLHQEDTGDLLRPERTLVLKRAIEGETVDAPERVVELADALSAEPEALRDYAYALAAQEARFPDDRYRNLRQVYDSIEPTPLLVEQLMGALTVTTVSDNPTAEARSIAETHEGWADAWLGLAAVYEEKATAGDVGDALEQAVEAEPDYPDAWRRLAQFAERQGDEERALEAYRELYRLQPENPVVMNNLAYFLLSTDGDVDEALRHAEAAAEELPNNPHVVHTLGLAQLRSDATEEAFRNLAFALELRPGDPTLLLDFGYALVETGREEAGHAHVQMALDHAEQLGLDFPRQPEAEALLAEG